MHEFAVGQRVRYVGHNIKNRIFKETPEEDLVFGMFGTVIKIDNHGPYRISVQFDAHPVGFTWLMLPEKISANIAKP